MEERSAQGRVIGRLHSMLKIATLIWVILGVTLAGIAFLVVLATPSLASKAGTLGVGAIAAGFLAAMPASWFVASKISRRIDA
jgi:hypothetical protein